MLSRLQGAPTTVGSCVGAPCRRDSLPAPDSQFFQNMCRRNHPEVRRHRYHTNARSRTCRSALQARFAPTSGQPASSKHAPQQPPPKVGLTDITPAHNHAPVGAPCRRDLLLRLGSQFFQNMCRRNHPEGRRHRCHRTQSTRTSKPCTVLVARFLRTDVAVS